MTEHILHEFADAGLISGPERAWAWGIGVDVFFVISGFVMSVTGADQFGARGAPLTFLTRRLRRVVPLYWIFTSLALVTVVLRPGTMNIDASNVFDVVCSYLFIPEPLPDGRINPILTLGWTLNYEVYFYVLFAVSMALPLRVGMVALFSTFVLLTLLHPLIPADIAPLRFWTNGIVLEFAAGVAVGLMFRRTTWRMHWLVGLSAIVVLFLLAPAAMDPNNRWMVWGPIATAICAVVAFSTEPQFHPQTRRGLLLLGDASYALYLSHPFAIGIAMLILARAGASQPQIAFVLVALCAVTGGIAAFLLLDRPMQRKLRPPNQRPEGVRT